MVETIFIRTILKRLEKYLIKRNNFHLLGDTFDLILFVPSDKYLSDAKYSLMVSAKSLNTLHQKDVIIDLLNDFKGVLKFDEYNAISRLNIIHSDDPFVKNLKLVFGFREEITEINEIPVGGVKIDYAFLVKSLVLDKLVEGRALIVEIKTENDQYETINMGVIRIETNFDIVYYTGKGIREMYKPEMTDEQKEIAEQLKQKSEDYLIQHHYIGKTPLDNILKVK
jgi:hypothetical protein